MIGYLHRLALLALLSISFTFLQAQTDSSSLLKVNPLCTGDAAHGRDWQIVNPGTTGVDVVWYLIGTDQYGKLSVAPGDTSFMTEVPYFNNMLFPSLMVIYWKNSYGWRRVGLTWGSSAICGQDQVSAANSDERIATDLLKMLAAYLLNNPNSGSGMGPGGAGNTGLAEVYGNPSTGVFRLYYSLDPNQQTTIGLYSTQGRPLQSRAVEQGAGYVDVDATGYQPGIYFLRVRNGGFTKTIKLIRN